MDKKPNKNPVGRPSKYTPGLCREVVDFMQDGYSVTAFAGHIGVARSTVFKWASEHPEFSDALKTAQAKAALWWEKALMQVASTGEGNASAAIFGVKNRSGEDWRDKQDVNHTSSDGSMSPTRIVIESGDGNGQN